jgi:phosphoglycolate phosphatase-like HAD superfamily hydrolase
LLLLFDIDGTLLLSGGAGSRALNRVFQDKYGIANAMDTINPAGHTDPFIVTEVFATHLGREPEPNEIGEVFTAYVPVLREELERSTHFRLMPKVMEVIDELAHDARYVLALATGNIRLAAQAKMQRGNLWHHFPTGGFACDSGHRHELVERGIARAQKDSGRTFAREEIVVIGDTVRDVAAARKCGVKAIAVTTGPSSCKNELKNAGADAVLADLGELFAHL